jgi:two-component system chemotaxis sensor kinase CheA
MKDLIAIFKAETEEHLTKLDNGLVELEKQPDNVDLAKDLNREVHTLKGAAGFLDSVKFRILHTGSRISLRKFRGKGLFSVPPWLRVYLKDWMLLGQS